MKINSERPMSKEHANTFEGLFELKQKKNPDVYAFIFCRKNLMVGLVFNSFYCLVRQNNTADRTVHAG